jgi:acyl-CoA thioester hydrolase
VLFGEDIRVGVRTTRLGNKSMEMEYIMEEAHSGQVKAEGSTVLVAYDYASGATITIPDNWRRALTVFEQLETV